ncbi:MAG: hypothetical protein JXI43_11625, partial [Tissierellales bacterium]|nr:hypothetical protein [Tissierellales bacterium]
TGRMTGTAIKRIILEKIREAPLPIPPIIEQRRIASDVERIISIVDGLNIIISANFKRSHSLIQTILEKEFINKKIEDND